jgi:hypothetical protein
LKIVAPQSLHGDARHSAGWKEQRDLVNNRIPEGQPLSIGLA